MTNTICLNENYSTTKLLTKEKPAIANSSKNKFETVLFLLEDENRKGEGGLRTKGYFKESYKNKSLISIVTVVYNGEKHLEQTIQSVISQTYDNVEYIIIDGGSTDGTLDIIKKYENQIDYWVSEPDSGIYCAMNKGIKVASGKFTAFINADDWYEKEAIDYISKAYAKEPNIKFFYGDINYIKEDGKVVLWKGNKGENGIGIPHPSCFIRSTILKQNLFNTSFKIAADTELTLKLFKSNITNLYVNQVISNFRSGGISSNFWAAQKESFFIRAKYISFRFALKTFLIRGLVIMKNNIKRKIQ